MSFLFQAVFVIQLIAMPPIAPFAPAIPDRTANPNPLITVVVLDPDGKPVSHASVMVQVTGTRMSHSAGGRTGPNGESQIRAMWFGPNRPVPDRGTVTAWTDMHAHGIEELDMKALETGSARLTVRLAKGRETEVRLTMPDGTMAPSDLGLTALEILKAPDQLSFNRGPARSSAGSFWFVTSEEADTLHLRTNEEARLVGWIHQVSTVDGPQSIQIPATGNLQVTFHQDRDGEGFLMLNRVIEQVDSTGTSRSSSTHTILQTNGEGEQIDFEIKNLHPGTYEVGIGTGKQEQMWSGQLAYGAKKRAIVEPGETVKLEFREGDHDRSVFDGRTNFDIQLEDGTGPASGVAWRLMGPHPELLVEHTQHVLAREGVTGADGVVRIEKINLEPLGHAHYNFVLALADGTKLGDINPFNVQNANAATRPLRFVIPARMGDPVADALITRVTDGSEVNISEWEGRVLAIVLWSNHRYADQCYETVDEWDITAARQASRWGDRVAMIAINTDSSLAEALRTIHERDWQSLDHYWAERPQPGQLSDVMRSLDTTTTPWIVILDPHRRIVASGAPKDVDVEAEIGKLLE